MFGISRLEIHYIFNIFLAHPHDHQITMDCEGGVPVKMFVSLEENSEPRPLVQNITVMDVGLSTRPPLKTMFHQGNAKLRMIPWRT
jgi:hypothetical protein